MAGNHLAGEHGRLDQLAGGRPCPQWRAALQGGILQHSGTPDDDGTVRDHRRSGRGLSWPLFRQRRKHPRDTPTISPLARPRWWRRASASPSAASSSGSFLRRRVADYRRVATGRENAWRAHLRRVAQPVWHAPNRRQVHSRRHEPRQDYRGGRARRRFAPPSHSNRENFQ